MRAGADTTGALMHITFKLFASLTDYLPPEARYTNEISGISDNEARL